MKKYKSTRLLALLLAVILCMSHATAANIIHEEDYEVVPDYSQMDTETAFTTYLRREMKLNPAAVCGILANIEYESDFSPTAWGDDGTSYGLCQWHESRCRSLRRQQRRFRRNQLRNRPKRPHRNLQKKRSPPKPRNPPPQKKLHLPRILPETTTFPAAMTVKP